MFVNRSSSSNMMPTSVTARSKIVPFDREPREGAKGQNLGDRKTKSYWAELWQAIGDWFLRGNEPHIQEKRDSSGQLYFKVYDPLARQNYVFDTENEVRAWLEKRYNY